MFIDEFYTLFNLRQEGIVMSITAPDENDISIIQCTQIDSLGHRGILQLDYPTGIILKNEKHSLDSDNNIVHEVGFSQDSVKYCEKYIMDNVDFIDCYRDWLIDYESLFVNLIEIPSLGTISTTPRDTNGSRDIKVTFKPGKFGIFRLDVAHNKFSKLYSWNLNEKQFEQMFKQLVDKGKTVRNLADTRVPGSCDMTFGEGMYLML